MTETRKGNAAEDRSGAKVRVQRIVTQQPLCHFTSMTYQFADDGCMQVDYWECEYCGHTKEISRVLAG